MRILHVAQPTHVGGVPQVVLTLVEDQVSRGHEVVVACPAVGVLAERARAAGATWQDWPATRSPGPAMPAETLRLARVVRRTRPDLLHLHSAKAGLAGRAAVRGRVPTVFQPHAWSFEAVEGVVRRATTAWERAATRWADLVLLVSEDERSRGLAARVRPRHSTVVPNGVDLLRWPAADGSERRRARARLGVGAGPVAVCVGRLCRQKGQDLLLDAWPAVLREAPGAHLFLLGEGPLAAPLQQRGVPSTTFTGPRDDVADWLAAADVVVLPSRWEAMALVPLEAMARARSLVACDVSGISESVPPGAGAVVPVDDADALAGAVAARLRGAVDPDEEGRTGRRHVEEHHDVRRTTAAVEAAYRRLLGPAPLDPATGG